MRSQTCVFATALVLALCCADAGADVFLLKDGQRLHGWLEKEYKDDYREKWLSVRATYGQVDFHKKLLKKHVKSKRNGPLLLDSARFIDVKGDVKKSDDGGETWTKVSMLAGETGDDSPFPPLLRAGETLRTGDDGRAELDLGFGKALVAAASELELVAKGEATLRMFKGRVGADVEGLPKKRDFRVETPQATMGVRGTTFVVTVSDRSRFAVGDGEVEVHAGKEKRSLGPSSAFDVSVDGTFTDDALDGDEEDFLADLSDILGYSFVQWSYVPGGTFDMGGGAPTYQGLANTPGTKVTLRPYLMARHEFTYAQWDEYLAWSERYGMDRLHRSKEPLGGTGVPFRESHLKSVPATPDEPAAVRWDRANTIARFLGGRLPSESEWEYACRGGVEHAFGFGRFYTDDVAAHGWTLYNSGDRTVLAKEDIHDLGVPRGIGVGMPPFVLKYNCRRHPVGQLKPNPLGLFDIIGNLREWCADAATGSHDDLPTDGAPVSGPSNAKRVIRGGGFLTMNSFAPVDRWGASPDGAIGVRVVREVP